MGMYWPPDLEVRLFKIVHGMRRGRVPAGFGKFRFKIEGDRYAIYNPVGAKLSDESVEAMVRKMDDGSDPLQDPIDEQFQKIETKLTEMGERWENWEPKIHAVIYGILLSDIQNEAYFGGSAQSGPLVQLFFWIYRTHKTLTIDITPEEVRVKKCLVGECDLRGYRPAEYFDGDTQIRKDGLWLATREPFKAEEYERQMTIALSHLNLT